jgi:hypothetical protein
VAGVNLFLLSSSISILVFSDSILVFSDIQLDVFIFYAFAFHGFYATLLTNRIISNCLALFSGRGVVNPVLRQMTTDIQAEHEQEKSWRNLNHLIKIVSHEEGLSETIEIRSI